MKNINKYIEQDFFNIRDKLYKHKIFTKKIDSHDFWLKYKYKLFGRHLTKETNYDFWSISFNRTFFFKNLLKCLLFFQYFPDLETEQIIDIGCGAAPASIAFSVIMKNNIQVSLIDKSETQLKLALEFLDMLAIPLNTCEKTNFRAQSIIFKGIAVFSYFLCEQNVNKFIKNLYANRKNFRDGIAIIDYESNIKKIYNYFRKYEEKDKIFIVKQSYMLSKEISKILKEDEIKVYGFFYRP